MGAFSPPCAPISFAFLFGRQRRQFGQGWLRSANKAFAGQEPIALIKRIDGLIHVCEYLDAYRARI